MARGRFVSYLRVSTDRQGRSGSSKRVRQNRISATKRYAHRASTRAMAAPSATVVARM